jgi:hypothetical protein
LGYCNTLPLFLLRRSGCQITGVQSLPHVPRYNPAIQSYDFKNIFALRLEINWGKKFNMHGWVSSMVCT